MSSSLFKHAAQAGLYYLPEGTRSDLRQQAVKAHRTLFSAHLENCKGIQEALVELGKACHFPIWYGANFDALNDCLSDPDWPNGKGVILKISGLETLRSGDVEAFSTLIDVLRSATISRSASKQPLWILLTTPARSVSNLPDA